jgi:hypothetical protein
MKDKGNTTKIFNFILCNIKPHKLTWYLGYGLPRHLRFGFDIQLGIVDLFR